MGFWKDVAYDMSRGMSKQTAIEVNAVLRDKNTSAKAKKKVEVFGELEIKLNSIK